MDIRLYTEYTMRGMTPNEKQPNSVRHYFETEVYPEHAAAIKAAEKKKVPHFIPRRRSRHEDEPMQTRWDCGCVTTLAPDGTILRSQCGTDDCLYDQGMANRVK